MGSRIVEDICYEILIIFLMITVTVTVPVTTSGHCHPVTATPPIP
jgi:hypothetical protein